MRVFTKKLTMKLKIMNCLEEKTIQIGNSSFLIIAIPLRPSNLYVVLSVSDMFSDRPLRGKSNPSKWVEQRWMRLVCINIILCLSVIKSRHKSLSFGRTLINPLLNPMDTPRLILSVRRAHSIDCRAALYDETLPPTSCLPCVHIEHRHVPSIYTR